MEIFLIYMWMYFDLVVEKVNKEIVKEKWLREIIVLNIFDLVKVKGMLLNGQKDMYLIWNFGEKKLLKCVKIW